MIAFKANQLIASGLSADIGSVERVTEARKQQPSPRKARMALKPRQDEAMGSAQRARPVMPVLNQDELEEHSRVPRVKERLKRVKALRKSNS